VSDQPIEREVLRGAIIESLRRQPQTQYLNLKAGVGVVLAERDLPVLKQGSGYPPTVRSADMRRFHEIIWQLINQNVLVQGINESNSDWPFMRLTEWGDDYVQQGGPDVYDPDGYLRDLASERKSTTLSSGISVRLSRLSERISRCGNRDARCSGRTSPSQTGRRSRLEGSSG